MYLIASAAASKLSPTALFMRGVIVVIAAFVIFVGSVWMVVMTDIGAKKAIMLVLSVLFAFISMLSLLWFRYPQQAPIPHGTVCLGGKVNPAFEENGGAAGESSVTVKRNVGGSEFDEKISACESGIFFTKFFYPAIFLVASIALSLISAAGLNRIEKAEKLADELEASGELEAATT